jgi:hypothetical protein
MLDYNSYIDPSALRPPQNRLEAIVLLSTGVESKELRQHIIDQLQNLSSLDKNIAKTIDLIFFVNKNHPNTFDYDCLKQFFKKVAIKSILIPKNKDFYFSGSHSNRKNPDYDFTHGDKSGPNYSFFRVFELCQFYNTCLFLESDCFLRKNWLNKINEYCLHANGFWVSGSKYMGCIYNPPDELSLIVNHINGGVCLYNTGDSNLQSFMYLLENFLKIVVQTAYGYPYDYMIPLLLHTYEKLNYDENCHMFTKYIRKYYQDNSIIANFSTTKDSEISINDIYAKYNPYIVHKKPHEYRKFTN